MRIAIIFVLSIVLGITGIIVLSEIDDARQLAAWHKSCDDFRKDVIESGQDYLVGGWEDGKFVIRSPNDGEVWKGNL